jgi:CubicO group peptidase (beta-lactamase class C family)
MKNNWLLAFLVAFLGANAQSPDADLQGEATLDELDAYFEKTAEQLGGSPFAAMVTRDGEILYERYDDAQGVLGKSVDEHSRWFVFSITKSFISALVLDLCDDGIVSLDDPVGKYLPAFAEEAVTIRHVMSHTSGAAVDGDKKPEPLPEDLDRIEIISKPGDAFEYSSLGMLILERALEASNHSDWNRLATSTTDRTRNKCCHS